MSAVSKIGDDRFEADVVKSDILTVVDFGATWCGPCKKLHPIMEELALQFAGKIKVFEVNVEDSTETAMKYGITSVPQLLFFKDGKVRETVVGLLPKSKIEEKIDRYLE
jgi:thioredoxin 1